MTFHQLLADRNCGMNTQAAELLARMSTEIVELPDGTFLSTSPYGNCREAGFVLTIHPTNGDPVNLAFYEHRNSDDICAIRWTGRLPISGVVSVEDIPSDAFPDKWSVTKSWRYGRFDEAIAYAREVVKEVTTAEHEVAA